MEKVPRSDERLPQDDLAGFHARTFHLPTPRLYMSDRAKVHTSEAALEPALKEDIEQGVGVDEEDDNLGYYHDGVKRTLTDEQVAMFRHSEIYAILRARQVARENEDIIDSDVEGEDEGVNVDENEGEVNGCVSSKEPIIDSPNNDSSTALMALHNDEKSTADHMSQSGTRSPNQEEPIRNAGPYLSRHEKLKRKRHEMEHHHENNNNNINSKIRERGRVRELDASFAEEQVLDYDDDDEVAPKTEQAHHQKAALPPQPEGKKIWWPVLAN